MGVANEKVNEEISNFEKLKEKNKGLNIANPNLKKVSIGEFFVDGFKLLTDKILNLYSPQFIVDILEYNGIDLSTFLNNYDNYLFQNLETYLKNNNIYSRKNLFYIFNNFEKLKPLLKSLIDNNIKLNDNEREYFQHYIKFLNYYHEMIDFDITTVQELRMYPYRKLEIINSILENSSNISEIQGKIAIALFENYGKKQECYNTYLIEKMKKLGLLDKYDLALIEIIKDFWNIDIYNQTCNLAYNNTKLEEFKTKYWSIVKKGINISTNYNKLCTKFKNYQLKLMNDKIKSNDFSNKKISEKVYNGKKIPIVEFDGDKFNFLVTAISGQKQNPIDDYGNIYNDLLRNPAVWNEIDIVSSISCSFISDKHLVTLGGVKLGFSNLPDESLIGIFNADANTSHGYNVLNPGLLGGKLEGIYSVDYFLKKTLSGMYNEVGLYRKNNHLKDFDGKIQPSFIISMNSEPREIELRYAAYFDIPIVKINEELYKKQNEEKANNYRTGNITKFDIEDVKEILSLKEFSESESEALIFSYLDKLELPDDEYNKFIDEVREVIIDFYIHDANKIDQVLSELEKHRRVTFNQEDGYGRH